MSGYVCTGCGKVLRTGDSVYQVRFGTISTDGEDFDVNSVEGYYCADCYGDGPA